MAKTPSIATIHKKVKLHAVEIGGLKESIDAIHETVKGNNSVIEKLSIATERRSNSLDKQSEIFSKFETAVTGLTQAVLSNTSSTDKFQDLTKMMMIVLVILVSIFLFYVGWMFNKVDANNLINKAPEIIRESR